MLRSLLVLAVFVLLVNSIQSAVIDDAVCDRQLDYFDDALSNREHWALYGKNRSYELIVQLSKRNFFFKFLTRGQNSNLAFFGAIVSSLEVSLIASSLDMNRTELTSELFKVNIA